MINKHLVSALLLGAALVFGPSVATVPALAMTDEVESYLGPEPTLFDTPEAAIAAFKDVLPDAIGQAPGLKSVVYGLVLILFVLFEPLGLYGRWLKIRTWFQLFPYYRKGLFKRQKSFQKSDRLK